MSVVAGLRELEILTRDGVTLSGQLWPAAEAPRGVLVIAHGICEHSGRYAHVVEALKQVRGLAVLSFDFRGHGRSPGRRGYVRRHADFGLDLQAAIAWAEREFTGLPRFVLGHSNGAVVALRAVIESIVQVSGLVLSNPALRVLRPASRPMLLLGQTLRYVAPGITLRSPVTQDQLTADLEMQADHLTDPLRHDRISAPVYFGLRAAAAGISAFTGPLEIPLLLILGGADPLVDPQASQAWFERLQAPDKSLWIGPAMRHEPFNEIGRQRLLADLARWIDARLGGYPTGAAV